MAIEVLLIVAVAAGAAVMLFRTAPRLAGGIILARRVLFGLIALIGALIFIATGRPGAIIVGAVILFLVTLAALYENENDTVY